MFASEQYVWTFVPYFDEIPMDCFCYFSLEVFLLTWRSRGQVYINPKISYQTSW